MPTLNDFEVLYNFIDECVKWMQILNNFTNCKNITEIKEKSKEIINVK